MEALARHRAITDSVLIAGDEDMVPAVEAAQAFGVRVHLWGIEPPYGTNQAERLVWESDTVDVLEGAFLRPYFAKNPTAVDPRSDPVLGPSPTAPTPSQLFGERHTRSTTRTGGFPAIGTPGASRRSGTPARCPASAPTGAGSRRPASTWRRSGS
jgi:hypothetical protein